MFDPQAPSNADFESLNPDLWKTELEGKAVYIPKDMKTNHKVKLNLERLVKSFMDVKPDFGLILGSNTTPPCNGIIKIKFRLCISCCSILSIKNF
jgi:hypothetical protein